MAITAQELIETAYTRYRGKGVLKTPVWGSEKSNTALSIANSKLKDWARDAKVSWVSNFRSGLTPMTQIGTVTTASDTTLTGLNTYFTDFKAGDTIEVAGETSRVIDTITSDTSLTVTVAFTNTASGLSFAVRQIMTSSKEYSLHRSFFVPSDTVTVKTALQDLTYKFASAEDRTEADVYISGLNPKKLTFSNDIETAAIGGELIVPGYFIPNKLILATDLVPIDDEEWLALSIAAEIARNDPSKENQFANLIGMANERYAAMIGANSALGSPDGSTIENNMPQISPDLDTDWSV